MLSIKISLLAACGVGVVIAIMSAQRNRTQSVPACCNCNLQDGESVHPASYRGCNHAKQQSLKLGKACGFDGMPSECFWHFPRRPLLYLTHLFNHCLQLGDFPAPWKEANIMTLPKPSKDQKFRPIRLLSATGKLRGSYQKS
jgi:hypothetical protein